MSADPNLDLRREIADLSTANLEDIRRRWQNVFGRPAPSTLPRPILLRLYAYRRQADSFGDLSAGTVQLLDRLGKARTNDHNVVPLSTEISTKGQLRPGTVLVREHGGKRHHVMVVADGFAWNGTTYSSLSLVAQAITGTKWNGPRFFGLRDRKVSS